MKKLYLISPDSEREIPEYINLMDLETCISTNDYLNKNLNSLKNNTPLLVSADLQTGGKGRDGRKWIPVGEGGVYISYLLNIKNHDHLRLLSITAGTAVAEAVKSISGIDLQLKWPNDIEFNGLKVGGILIENKLFGENIMTIIGLGLNANVSRTQLADEISQTATSLSIISQNTISMGELILRISEFLIYFKSLLEEGNEEKILNRYLLYLKHKKGDLLNFHRSGKSISGEFVKINKNGGLVLKQDDGTEETFFSGEILNST